MKISLYNCNFFNSILLFASLTEAWGPKPKGYTDTPDFIASSTTASTPVEDVDEGPPTTASTVCPRNEDMAKFQGRVCMKRCEADADCKSANRKCMCDSVCGLSCIKIDKECQNLRAPDFGRMKVNGRLFSSTAKYACRENYQLIGPSTRVCQSDGVWSGSEPICKEINLSAYCEAAPDISNAHHNGTADQTTFAVDTLLFYSCYEGYQIRGMFAEAKCLLYNDTAKWFGPDMACEPKRCTKPPNVANAITENDCTDFLCKASYNCSGGFELIGKADIYCQSDGTWQPSELPRCQPIHCAPPLAPPNGRVSLRSAAFSSVVEYTCDRGYMLVGDATRTCSSNGRWSGPPPVCEAPSEIDCGSPGPLYNGWIGGNSTAMGSQVTFHCNENTVRVGQFDTSTCSSNGRWSQPIPKCMGPCTLPQVSRGEIVDDRPDNSTALKTVVQHGTAINVSCEKGFEIHLQHEMPKCYNGSWTHMPICTPGRCKALPSVADNGYAIAPKNEHGSRARYACKDGYVLKGSSFTTCQFGKWVGTIPKCQIVYCKFPGSLANGSVLLVGNMGLYDYRAYVRKVRNNRMITYKCRRGFTLTAGPPGATCVNGHWRPLRMPACVHDQHPMLTTWFSKRSVQQTDNTTVLSNQRTGNTTGTSRRKLRRKNRRRQNRKRKVIREPLLLTELETSLAPVDSVSYEFVVGGDIASNETFGETSPCGPPAHVQNSVIFHNGEHTNSSGKRYPLGTEITFNCVTGMGGVKTSWKITCENGSWLGRSFSCDDDELYDFSGLNNKSCIIYNNLKNVMTFFNDQPVLEKRVEFPPGTRLLFRCDDIGKYTMSGSNVRTCVRGEWTGMEPSCYGLNQMNDYALEKPPTILFRHNGGSIAQTNDGRLAVYPGTILHLECLWIRKFGSPSWEISHQLRSYPQGWTTEDGRDSNLEYRLTIYHAQMSDSGIYTCVTPQRHRHVVHIDVKAIHCDEIPDQPGLHKSSHNTQMNTVVAFSCSNGNTLMGAHQTTCLPSTQWSAPLPRCQTIECPTFSDYDSNLKIAVLSRQVSGKAIFECPRGYERLGSHDAYCQFNGEWSQTPPSCRELLCETPSAPELGYMNPNKQQYLVGDILQFSCRHGYMLDGKPLVRCLENKKWSEDIPKCVQACTYPGTTIGGTISSVKFYYAIGEIVMFACVNGSTLDGENNLECLQGGVWSHNIPTCTVYQ